MNKWVQTFFRTKEKEKEKDAKSPVNNGSQSGVSSELHVLKIDNIVEFDASAVSEIDAKTKKSAISNVFDTGLPDPSEAEIDMISSSVDNRPLAPVPPESDIQVATTSSDSKSGDISTPLPEPTVALALRDGDNTKRICTLSTSTASKELSALLRTGNNRNNENSDSCGRLAPHIDRPCDSTVKRESPKKKLNSQICKVSDNLFSNGLSLSPPQQTRRTNLNQQTNLNPSNLNPSNLNPSSSNICKIHPTPNSVSIHKELVTTLGSESTFLNIIQNSLKSRDSALQSFIEERRSMLGNHLSKMYSESDIVQEINNEVESLLASVYSVQSSLSVAQAQATENRNKCIECQETLGENVAQVKSFYEGEIRRQKERFENILFEINRDFLKKISLTQKCLKEAQDQSAAALSSAASASQAMSSALQRSDESASDLSRTRLQVIKLKQEIETMNERHCVNAAKVTELEALLQEEIVSLQAELQAEKQKCHELMLEEPSFKFTYNSMEFENLNFNGSIDEFGERCGDFISRDVPTSSDTPYNEYSCSNSEFIPAFTPVSESLEDELISLGFQSVITSNGKLGSFNSRLGNLHIESSLEGTAETRNKQVTTEKSIGGTIRTNGTIGSSGMDRHDSQTDRRIQTDRDELTSCGRESISDGIFDALGEKKIYVEYADLNGDSANPAHDLPLPVLEKEKEILGGDCEVDLEHESTLKFFEFNDKGEIRRDDRVRCQASPTPPHPNPNPTPPSSSQARSTKRNTIRTSHRKLVSPSDSNPYGYWYVITELVLS